MGDERKQVDSAMDALLDYYQSKIQKGLGNYFTKEPEMETIVENPELSGDFKGDLTRSILSSKFLSATRTIKFDMVIFQRLHIKGFDSEVYSLHVGSVRPGDNLVFWTQQFATKLDYSIPRGIDSTHMEEYGHRFKDLIEYDGHKKEKETLNPIAELVTCERGNPNSAHYGTAYSFSDEYRTRMGSPLGTKSPIFETFTRTIRTSVGSKYIIIPHQDKTIVVFKSGAYHEYAKDDYEEYSYTSNEGKTKNVNLIGISPEALKTGIQFLYWLTQFPPEILRGSSRSLVYEIQTMPIITTYCASEISRQEYLPDDEPLKFSDVLLFSDKVTMIWNRIGEEYGVTWDSDERKMNLAGDIYFYK